jgi:hypothetical protein
MGRGGMFNLCSNVMRDLYADLLNVQHVSAEELRIETDLERDVLSFQHVSAEEWRLAQKQIPRNL